MRLEQLESGTMLSGPGLKSIISVGGPLFSSAAVENNRAAAVFTSMIDLLQTRVTNQPLASLAAGKISGTAFVAKLSAARWLLRRECGPIPGGRLPPG